MTPSLKKIRPRPQAALDSLPVPSSKKRWAIKIMGGQKEANNA
jgi:hypothetical protein